MKLKNFIVENILLIIALIVTITAVTIPIVLSIVLNNVSILFWLFDLIPCFILIMVVSAIIVNKDKENK